MYGLDCFLAILIEQITKFEQVQLILVYIVEVQKISEQSLEIGSHKI